MQVAAVIIVALLLIDDDIIKQFFNDSSQQHFLHISLSVAFVGNVTQRRVFLVQVNKSLYLPTSYYTL